MLIARYTANASGVVPTFNEGYQYTVNETVSDGIYTVELYSDTDFTSCSFRDKSNLLTVEYLKVTSQVTTMKNMFRDCSKLTQLDLSNWDTSKVTSMSYMFATCSSLTQLDISNFNTSNVISMSCMFATCSSLTQLDVSNWNTKNVMELGSMFANCSSLTQLDASNWDTSKVTGMSCMFATCSSLTQLDVSNWDTSSVTDMINMFNSCSSLNEIIANNVSTSTLSKLVTALPTKSASSYGTIKVTKTTNEITSSANAKYWNINVPMLVARYTANRSGVVPAFNEGYQYTVEEINNDGIYTVEIYSYDDFSSCSFNGQTNLLTVEYLKVTSSVTSMSEMFYDCNNLTKLNADNWDTSNVTTTYYMFLNCKQLTQVDLSNWNTSNITTMYGMFDGCIKLAQLDLSDFNTSKVKNMGCMFSNCKELTQLDLSNFNTSDVTNMTYMFNYCSQLIQLNASNWDMSKAKNNRNYMFQNCSQLNNIIANNISTSTLSELVKALPTRTSNSPGSLNITGVDDINQVDTSAAKSKYWDLYFVHIHKTKISRRKSIMIGDKKIGSLYVSELKKI